MDLDLPRKPWYQRAALGAVTHNSMLAMHFRESFIKFILCLLLLPTTLFGNRAVLCYEADGIVSIEWSSEECCADGETTPEPSTMHLDAAPDCGPCIDVALELAPFSAPQPDFSPLATIGARLLGTVPVAAEIRRPSGFLASTATLPRLLSTVLLL